MGKVNEFSDANFSAEVLQASKPVLVDFWAPWCGPCRLIGPVVEQVASDNPGAIKVGKVNIDDSPSLATSYSVSNIPTLMIFKGGEVVARFVGIQSKERIQDALDEAMA